MLDISTNVVIGIIVFIVILLIYILYQTYSSYGVPTPMYSLSGMWLADEEFCKEAGVDIMSLHISLNLKTYWLIIKSATIEIAHVGKIKISSVFYKSKHCTDREVEYNVEFMELPDDVKEVFAPSQTIRLNVANTRLRMYNGSKVYLQAYKDPKLTMLTKIEEPRKS